MDIQKNKTCPDSSRKMEDWKTILFGARLLFKGNVVFGQSTPSVILLGWIIIFQQAWFPWSKAHNVYNPGTQMTLVLIERGLLLEGSTPKTKDEQAPGLHLYVPVHCFTTTFGGKPSRRADETRRIEISCCLQLSSTAKYWLYVCKYVYHLNIWTKNPRSPFQVMTSNITLLRMFLP